MEISYSGPSERIDTWLSKQLPYTRSFFHHILSRGGITLQGKVIKKSHKLKEGDVIHIDDLTRYTGSEIMEETPKIFLPIILDMPDYLVLNKPKGVLSHPRNLWELQEPSVVGFLYHNYKDLPSIGNFIRAGLMHRLDKETDGLMIIAKTERGLAHFKHLFSQKSESETIEEKEAVPLKKMYKATSKVTPEGKAFLDSMSDFPFFIQENVLAKVPYTSPKLGITKILAIQPGVNKDPLLNTQDLILLTIEILTGRTHQIRYHLAHHGLPILGDYLYGKDEGIPLHLQAYRLEFLDPDGQMQVVEI